MCHLVPTLHANDCKGALRLLEMGVTVQELCQSINLISNQRLITTQTNTRELVCEVMNQNQVEYFLNTIMNYQIASLSWLHI